MKHSRTLFFCLAAAVFLAAGILGVCFMIMDKTDLYTVPWGDKPVVNPLKGWTPWSISADKAEYPISMAFVLMKWSDIEPYEGNYEFARLEETLQMDELRKQGVRFVLRIVCDYPSDEEHMDIPQWLYDKTYGDGQWYDNSYGKGYSPNYYNPAFLEAHRRLMEKLGEYYGNDEQIAFIELGSLGHWGEWHVNISSGIMAFPKSVVTDKYVQHYLDNFDASRLLLRRPFHIGADEKMGLYNDSFGQEESHELWLDWIRNGYVSDQNQESLSGMPDFWKYAPSGGEFSSAADVKYYFTDGLEETTEFIRRSHTTFIGPHCGVDLQDEECTDGVLQLGSEMGYCFRVNEAVLTRKFLNKKLFLQFEIENIGVAPIYENWKMMVHIVDSDGKVVCDGLFDIGLDQILPGKKDISITIEGAELERGDYEIIIGFVDPLTGNPGIRLANECEDSEFEYKIMEFAVK